MSHTCHLPPCKRACAPQYLFCREHWDLVPSKMQQEVYRTVKLRGSSVDKTWAPWWRAQAAATVHVLRRLYKVPRDMQRIDKIEQREAKFVAQLEGKVLA